MDIGFTCQSKANCNARADAHNQHEIIPHGGRQGIKKINFRKRKSHYFKNLVVIPKEEMKRPPIVIHATDKRGRN